MARKPNYRFERNERDRVQAERRAARQALKEQRKGEGEPGSETAPGEDAAPVAAESPASEPPSATLTEEPAEAERAAPVETAEAAATASDSSPMPETAMKPFDEMTSDELSILHQNALRLVARGTPKQKQAAQQMLPRLEQAMRRVDEARRQRRRK